MLYGILSFMPTRMKLQKIALCLKGVGNQPKEHMYSPEYIGM
jgi:hypothetical protein